LSLVFFATVVCNAFVCGALAGPNERYQARLVWIAPVLAALFVLAHREALGKLFRRGFARSTKARDGGQR
ncbi:MAG TPA: hypothetical protein VHV08_16485, partial [Pirellulales bacterium]|nr:hypothetical protein [Pirellulales bacterium]